MISNSPMSSVLREGKERLGRLVTYRLLGTVTVLLAAYYFFFASLNPFESQLFTAAALSAVAFLLMERILIGSGLSFVSQLLLQFSLDLLLVSLLVLLTGGILSPFVFLFGLVIVAAGTQSHVLVVLLTTILACICYLGSIHGFASWKDITITLPENLHILLQTSALFLVGGVMAAIARRHSSLQQERYQAVSQHLQLQELHEKIVSSMQEGILILDKALNIQDSNAAAWHFAGSQYSLSGLNLQTLHGIPDSLINFLCHGEKDSFQCEWKTDERISLVIATALPDDDPSACWLLTMVDISDVRQLERRLAEQDKLAAMGRMVAMLAHELRNPLQTIGQSVELIGKLSREKRNDIQGIVKEEVNRLNRLVSDMLDFVQPLNPEPVQCSCADLIGSSVVQVDLQEEYRIEWQSDVEQLTIDRDHFRLALDNLLRNAVEASPEPASVSVKLSSDDHYWQLSISDRGGGIPEAVRDRLFEPFATGRSSGIGLGLATVWQVCQANGWHVYTEPVDGGTQFTIRGRNLPNPEGDSNHG